MNTSVRVNHDDKGEQQAKHGVYVTEHKHWNTKEIFNNGQREVRYGHQPKVIHFRSPMVNDFNQSLYTSAPGNREATVQQLINHRKPFARIIYWSDQVVEAKDTQDRLKSSGLITELRRRKWQGCNTDHVWDLLACHDLRVRDIGDLGLLRKDYAKLFETCPNHDNMEDFADMPLSAFFDGWDSPPLPLWLGGACRTKAQRFPGAGPWAVDSGVCCH